MRGSARIRTPGFLFASPLGETAFAHKCSSPLSLLLSVPGTTRSTQTWAPLPCSVHASTLLRCCLYLRHTPRLWRLNYVSCICPRADGATAGSQSPSQVRNKCHVISHVASGCDPTGRTPYVGTLMPRSHAETTDGLGLSEVRTCKVPPTHRYAVLHGSAPSPITLTAKRSFSPMEDFPGAVVA